MGCNIHLLVERKRIDTDRWTLCDIDEMTERNYRLYARMAGVRNYYNSDRFTPRGFPEDINRDTMTLTFALSIKEYNSSYGDIPKAIAKRWVSLGQSQFLYYLGDKEPSHVTNPDHHTASWLTTQEFRQCFNDVFVDEDGSYKDDYVAWLGLVSYMEGIESDGKHKCRCVFAFDN